VLFIFKGYTDSVQTIGPFIEDVLLKNFVLLNKTYSSAEFDSGNELVLFFSIIRIRP
jgi:hypothetical protein